ncbi:putative hydrolase of the HAD superfamily [Arachidicoccus rhizosphaerae]|jgi:putative hydrolase of the HAD superfamily|uniref:Putative hydrolase of the HAD superfamily n=1 Tax=Arachidicoccus rhizosphaerae TaxID=551991 RepID=A0A1H3XPN7_9BACT|nr:HAD family phosphatase [Arachidicoccus rhizosphaerae]SEA01200.1 putative hydrolase of the HAD superfamily [Arachidicoccus rhizosphaerae]
METKQSATDIAIKKADQTFNKADIKNIIFDFGGVLLHIDFKRTHQAFEALGIEDAAAHFSQHHASQLFSRLETGHISNEAFYDLFREEAENPRLTNEQIRDAWNAMLLHYAKDNIALLKRLSNSYQLYLFSNTNQIHYDWFADLYQKEFNGEKLEDLFKVAWFSHEKGVRKPDPSVFTHMLEVEGLKAEQTLFIDDTVSNIQGAHQAGLKTHLLKSPAELLLLDL